jgi:hypothetical protein
MPIIVNLDVMMARRKISLNELSERVNLTLSNLSILKTGKQKQFVLAPQFARRWTANQVTFWNMQMAKRRLSANNILGNITDSLTPFKQLRK